MIGGRELRLHWSFATIVAASFLIMGGTPAEATEVCPNETLRTELLSAALPDCRAYELVSPVAKNGWPVEVLSADGSHVIMESFGAFAGSDQRVLLNSYESSRGEAGWVTLPFDEPLEFNPINQFGNPVAETNNLSEALFEYGLAKTGEESLYSGASPLIDSLAEIGPVFPPAALESHPLTTTFGLQTSPSASGNLESVLFAIRGPSRSFEVGADYLWPGDNTVDDTGSRDGSLGFFSLYEYSGKGNSVPALVGVGNHGEQISQCGTSLGFPKEESFLSQGVAETYNAISSDGLKGVLHGRRRNRRPGRKCMYHTGEW